VYCSGSAIAKNIIITAAHCVSEWSGSSAPVAVPTSRVGFQGVDGTWYMPHHVYLDPGWNAFYGDDDIALLVFDGRVVTARQVLSLYRENDEVGKEVLLSGLGRTGTGLTGEILGGGTIRAGTNVIESADASTLYVDFDPPSGTPRLGGAPDVYPGTTMEIFPAHGDSGGPWVIGNRLAGITTFGDGSGLYGEVHAATRISAKLDWLDPILAAEAIPPSYCEQNRQICLLMRDPPPDPFPLAESFLDPATWTPEPAEFPLPAPEGSRVDEPSTLLMASLGIALAAWGRLATRRRNWPSCPKEPGVGIPFLS
jgi:hypothetical protein